MLVKILVTFSEVTLLNNKKMKTSLNIYWNPLGKSCSKQPLNIFFAKTGVRVFLKLRAKIFEKYIFTNIFPQYTSSAGYFQAS